MRGCTWGSANGLLPIGYAIDDGQINYSHPIPNGQATQRRQDYADHGFGLLQGWFLGSTVNNVISCPGVAGFKGKYICSQCLYWWIGNGWLSAPQDQALRAEINATCPITLYQAGYDNMCFACPDPDSNFNLVGLAYAVLVLMCLVCLVAIACQPEPTPQPKHKGP
jgi:hypothetical protein